jgi:hypothetical protein
MELLTAIALLCQVHHSAGGSTQIGSTYREASQTQLKCQQYYVHCVGVKKDLADAGALKQCILEKK